MSTRHREPQIHPGQESLFVVNQQTGMVHPQESLLASSLADPNIAEAHGSLPGPHVNVLERNAHLQNMLQHLGVVSRTAGLQFIATTGQRRELEERYDSVDRVVGAATNRSENKQREAKTAFAKAFGLQSMIASGLVSEGEAKAMAASTYSHEVLPVFADARNATRRETARRWLNFQERTLTGKATRKPKLPLPKPPKVV